MASEAPSIRVNWPGRTEKLQHNGLIVEFWVLGLPMPCHADGVASGQLIVLLDAKCPGEMGCRSRT